MVLPSINSPGGRLSAEKSNDPVPPDADNVAANGAPTVRSPAGQFAPGEKLIGGTNCSGRTELMLHETTPGVDSKLSRAVIVIGRTRAVWTAPVPGNLSNSHS